MTFAISIPVFVSTFPFERLLFEYLSALLESIRLAILFKGVVLIFSNPWDGPKNRKLML